jgi:hypothetical protein
MSSTRIPENISEFNSYINATDDYQKALDPSGIPPGATNASRLGLVSGESTGWTEKRDYWHDTLYPAYNNPITSSSTVKQQVKLFMKDFRTFGNPLLNRMAASGAATSDDEAVFRFVAVRDTVPTERGKIDDIPFGKLIPMGGGEFKIKVRTTSDSTRSSRHPLSDGVEVRWAVVAPTSEAATGAGTGADPAPTGPGSAAAAPPTVSSDCPNTIMSPKAIFVLATGEASKNKNLYCFFRWVNQSKPANNGQWSERVQSGIL